MLIRIADVLLDISQGSATTPTGRLPLSPRLFATLRTLAERPGEVVTREDLMRAVWPDTHVESNNISQAIAAVRRALSATGAAGCIETVPGRGYMLIGAVEVLKDPPEPARRWLTRAVVVAACAALVATGGRDHAHQTQQSLGPVPAWVTEARALLATRGAAEMRNARAMLAAGVAANPSQASAWTALAEADYLLGFYGLGESAAGASRASAARAIALDPESARAYVVRASITLDADWDLSASAKDFRKALEIDRDDALVQHWLAWWCLAAGRLPEAAAAVDRAVRLQPLSASALTARATFAYLAGDFRASIADAGRVIEMDPAFSRAHLRIGLSHMALGNTRAGITWLDRAYGMSPEVPEIAAALTHARALAGDDAEAARLYAKHASMFGPYDDAIVLTGMGRPFEAVGRLSAARRDGRLTPGLFAVEPRLAPLRDIAGFRRLLASAPVSGPASLFQPPAG